jgi:hypothetical protein
MVANLVREGSVPVKDNYEAAQPDIERGDDGGKAGEEKPLGQEGPYLGPWKTREEAEKGVENLTKKMGEQGNELGALRRQVEMATQIITDIQGSREDRTGGRGAEGTGSALDDQLAQTLTRFEQVDFDNPEVGKQIAGLVADVSTISRKMGQEEAVRTATSQFQQALSEKDQQALQANYMRSEEGKMLQQLRTQGKLDEMRNAVEFPQLEDDLTLTRLARITDLSTQLNQASARIQELEGILSKDKGESTKAVYTKAGGQNAQVTGKTRARSEADVDAAMLAAIRAAPSEG